MIFRPGLSMRMVDIQIFPSVRQNRLAFSLKNFDFRKVKKCVVISP